MKMRYATVWCGLGILLGMVGCGPTHQHTKLLEVGTPLYLTVKVPKDKAADAAGTLYYRWPDAYASGSDAYQQRQLDQRGHELTAELPTQSLRAGQSVAYYFDVIVEGELTPLGSVASPYVTEFVSRDELIERTLRFGVTHGREGERLAFTLSSGRYDVEWAKVWYSPPDLVGRVEQELINQGRSWVAEVNPGSVTPGAWTYRIEAEVEGKVYRYPTTGETASFKVSPAAKKNVY
ncbi:MAG: hypothetical protein AAF333_08110 [Planctomycetota bacterium]